MVDKATAKLSNEQRERAAKARSLLTGAFAPAARAMAMGSFWRASVLLRDGAASAVPAVLEATNDY